MATLDYIVGYCDAWEEGKHPRDKEGKFSESTEGKVLAGHSAGALASAGRAPGKEGHAYSKTAHEASQRALETDKPEDHTWARDLHKAAAGSHQQLAQKHGNYAGPHGEHGAAGHNHNWASAAHQERLNALWEKSKPKSSGGETVAVKGEHEWKPGDEVHDAHGWGHVEKVEGGRVYIKSSTGQIRNTHRGNITHYKKPSHDPHAHLPLHGDPIETKGVEELTPKQRAERERRRAAEGGKETNNRANQHSPATHGNITEKKKLDAIEDELSRMDGPFQKMEAKLEGKVRDPAAVAAKIGREELGQKEMTRRSVAGREHGGG